MNSKPPPKVSVLMCNYNYGDYIAQAIKSVLEQTLTNFELIIVDDSSIYGSVEIISEKIKANPETIFIQNEYNLGNCKSFNRGYSKSTGSYIIDLSADAFYATGEDYSIVITTGTVGGVSVVGYVVGTFSIQNRYTRGTDSAALASALASTPASVPAPLPASSFNFSFSFSFSFSSTSRFWL